LPADAPEHESEPGARARRDESAAEEPAGGKSSAEVAPQESKAEKPAPSSGDAVAEVVRPESEVEAGREVEAAPEAAEIAAAAVAVAEPEVASATDTVDAAVVDDEAAEAEGSAAEVVAVPFVAPPAGTIPPAETIPAAESIPPAGSSPAVVVAAAAAAHTGPPFVGSGEAVGEGDSTLSVLDSLSEPERQRFGWVVRMLELLNRPFDFVTPATRELLGKVAIVTTIHAAAVMLYVYFVRG